MRIFYLFIFLCLIASAAFVFNRPHLQRPEHEEPIQKLTLDNGLTAIIKNSDKVPLIAVRLVVKTGSATEGRFAGRGISHFTEHMLFKGTPSRAVGEIEKQIKSYGGYINASTSHDATEVQLLIKREYLREALELLSDIVFNPAFEEAEFEKEREVILSEIRMNRDEPSRRASVLLWSNAYLAHPYRYPVIGYEGLFKELSREDLMEYHAAKYIPGNCVLSIVGDLDVGDAVLAAKDMFGKLPRQPDIQSAGPIEPLQVSARRAEEEIPQLKLSRAMIAFHGTALANEDLYPLDLLAVALGEGESSRLYRRLVKDKKLAYSVSAYNYTPRDAGLFIIGLALEEDKIEEAVAEVLNELRKIKRSSLSSGELNKVKKAALSSFIYSKESIEAQADDYASNYALTGDYDFSKRYLRGIDAVKRSDVRRVANRYLDLDNMTVAVVKARKESTGNDALNLKKNKNFTAFAPFVSTRDENVEKEGSFDVLKFDIKKTSLPNGATILLCEDRSLPIVSMSILFRGGVRAEDKATNGLSHLMASALLQGTRSHSGEWIAKETESRGIIFTSFSGKNSFGISVKCLKADFDFSLDLVSDILRNANFPEKEVGILKDLQLAAIKAQDDDIFATASKELIKSIFKYHPYGMPDLGTEESVNNLKRDGLVKYYRRFAVPDNMVVSIFGDIDIVKTRKAASAIFGRLRGRLDGLRVPPEPEQTGSRQSLRQMFKEQSVLMMGYPGVDIKNPDKYALDVINSILSHEGGRLYTAIRERLGLSYTLGSFSVLGVDPGYNALYVATSYKNAQEAKRLLLGQIKSLKSEGPTQEEMNLAKSDLTGGYFRGLEIGSEVGFRAGLDELYGLGYENIFSYPAAIGSVTADDVIRVMRKYFADSRLNEILIYPAADAESGREDKHPSASRRVTSNNSFIRDPKPVATKNER